MNVASASPTALLIDGPVGAIEVLIDEPTVDAQHVAVVCHPHPLFGGNMTNKVTHILARSCNDLGAIAVRFNFRGVGKSSGTHDDGRGETDDVVAVLKWSEQRWPGKSIWLAGFSFGAAMALRAALVHPVARLVTVAPALRWLQQLAGAEPKGPWLIAQGDQDELVDAQAVRKWAENLSQPPTLVILAGAEHFFHGRLNDLRDVVKSWLIS
ncbi:MAG: alpha/beta fold hydrolase [Candidatus Obscuribacterales bacterium]|nr:alpha/beta fold hydrolase [Steroidobacteraceae bacterium]